VYYSKLHENTALAYAKGYRVVDGIVMSPYSKEPRTLYTKMTKKHCSYKFTIKTSEGKGFGIPVHKLVAYQKFGDKAFETGTHVRHLDGDSLNNSEENIALGTPSENSFDRPHNKRKQSAIKTATAHRKFSDKECEEIRKYHEETRSYKKVMAKFNIPAKSSLRCILTTEYVTTV
jgi:hypothetical protein